MRIPIKIRLLLWLLSKSKSLPTYEMNPVDARRASEKRHLQIGKYIDFSPIPLFNIFDTNIPGRDGEIPVRIYQASNQKNLPTIVFFHGGGFVLRSVDSHDKVCRRIARDNNAVVISVEYRLAPEFKFPIPLNDCYDATVWASKNADIHKGDTSRLVVMGDSAGGNLSTAVCLLSRDLKGPKICYQVLIYPCTDATLSCASIDEYKEGYLLTKKVMHWFIDHYKTKDEDVYSPYLSMLLAKDLTNLPPAFIFTAEYDPLKDEGRQYAERMKEAGNKVIYKDYGGMIHGFMNMPKISKHVLLAYDDIKNILTKNLS